MRKAQTWRTHHNYKNFEMAIHEDFNQRKTMEMLRYLSKFKAQVSEPGIRSRIEKQMSNLKKKIGGEQEDKRV